MVDLKRYLAVPYKSGGRSWDGADCWGLVCLLYANELGVALPLYDGIDALKHELVSPHIEAAQRSSEWASVPLSETAPFDVVLARITGHPWHLGVLLEDRQFIHSLPSRGVTIDRITSVAWKSRLLGAYRWSRMP